MQRIAIAVLLGTVTLFVLGGVLYGVLLGEFYQSNLGSAVGVSRDVPVGWALVGSELALAGMITYVCRHARVRSARAGVKCGAILGILYGVAIAWNLYAVTNWSRVLVALVEPFVTATQIAVTGGAIGWALGRERLAAEPELSVTDDGVA